MVKILIKDKNYTKLLAEIKNKITSAQYESLKAVNKALISLYWEIGKAIYETQKEESWGENFVKNLSRDLQSAYPGTRGFSAANLWRMKLFYEKYYQSEKLAPLVREISWSHNIVIIEKCKDELQQLFYIRMSHRQGWTKNVLIHHIENQTYEKTLLNQNNFDKTLPEPLRQQAKLSLKDEYIFGFLELSEEHSEQQLEKAILSKIEHFLREMGGQFTFMGSQFPLEVDGKEFFIDILLYHRYLKCLVAIELKIGEFKPEYVGKMQFYLRALDEKVRLENENSSIGIILCKSKSKTIVEYALYDANKPIGVAEYKVFNQLPAVLQSQLPSPELIAAFLDEI